MTSPRLENTPTPARPGRRLALVLLTVVVALVALHLLNQTVIDRVPIEQGIRYDEPTYRLGLRFFHLDREQSLPAWFSTLLLALNAALMAGIAFTRRKVGERDAFHWALLAALFGFLSLDEAASIHEVLASRVQDLMGDWATGYLFGGWYLPVLVAVMVLAVVLVPFWWRQRPILRWMLATGVAIFLGGAVGCEAVMGATFEHLEGDPPFKDPGLAAVLLLVAEEAMEMLGMVLICWALVGELAPRLQVRVVPYPLAESGRTLPNSDAGEVE